jgi:PAS domain S-box-containing protein
MTSETLKNLNLENQSDHYVTIAGRDGTVLYANPSFCRDFCKSPGTVTGQSLFNLVDEFFAEKLVTACDFCFRNPEQKVSIDINLPGKEPNYFRWEFSATPSGPGGEVALQCLGRNITGQKRLEETLHYQGILLDHVGDAIISLDNNLQIVSWNRKAEKLFEIASPEVVGKKLDEVLQYSFLYHNEQEVFQAVQQLDHWEGEVSFVNTSGQTRYLWIEADHIRDQSDQSVGVVCIHRDISDKVVLRQQLAHEKITKQQQIMQSMIRAQEEEKKRMAEELHDDITQTLGAAALYLDTAMNDPENVLEYLRQGKGLLRQATEAIRQLSHQLSGNKLFRNGLVRSLEALIQPLRAAGRFQINLEIEDGLVDRINADQQLAAYRTIQEQLNNIIKYACPGQVFVECRIHRNRLYITVADDGLGFNSASCNYGLGLHNIILRAESLQGKATIWSAPGKGCKLRVKLPLEAI